MNDFSLEKEKLAQLIRSFNAKGWSPATSTNYSIRENENAQTFWVSKSGKDKSEFTADDFMEVHLDGQPCAQFKDIKPSAETLIHCSIYKMFPSTCTILHSHSLESVCLSQMLGNELEFTGYEVQKAFDGETTHDSTIRIPIFENTQDMVSFSNELLANKSKLSLHSFVMRMHGTYAWGKNLFEAKRHIEALEYLIACELRCELRTLN